DALDHRGVPPADWPRSSLTRAAVCSGFAVACPLQPLQHKKTVSPASVSFTGAPIEPRRLSFKIGQVRCCSASLRSAGGSLPRTAAIFASGSSGVVARTVLVAAPPAAPLEPPK